MNLLFATDLHGSEAQYARLIALTQSVRPDVLVLGGDLLPDDSALEPQKMGRSQPAFVRQQFRKHAQTLREAVKQAAVLVVFGNHDWGSSATAMQELVAEETVSVLNHHEPRVVEGVAFVGYSSTPPTPWFVKDFEKLDCPGDVPPLLGGARWDPRFNRPSTLSSKVLFGPSYPTMMDELAHLKAPSQPWVFVAHAPPYDTKLDRFYGSQSWGSKAIRAAIERHQPMLSLHGHIHESPAVTGAIQDSLGKTIAVNPGQSRSQLSYALINIDVGSGRVAGVQHGQHR